MAQVTFAQLTVSTTVADGDLFAGYPSGGPLYGITAANLRIAMENKSLLLDGSKTMTGAVVAAVGSQGSPSITFTGDADTGIYHVGANQLGIGAGGLQYLQVDSSGVSTINGASFVGPLVGNFTSTAGLIQTTSSRAQLSILANAGQYRTISLQTDSYPRWALGANITAESGANAGSDFILNCYDDSGTIITTAVSITRATGAVAMPAGLTATLIGNASTASAWATPRTLSITGSIAYTSPPIDGSANGTAVATIQNNGDVVTWSGLQTLSGGANTTPAATPATNAVGYLGLPQNAKSGDYTLLMSDAGKEIAMSGSHTLTIPANASVALPIGTITEASVPSGSTLTVAITSDTLRWIPSNGTGGRTLTGPGIMTLRKYSATEWWCWGLGVS